MPLIVRPRNNYAAFADEVSDGVFPFDTTYATTDGPDEPGVCFFSGYTNINSDLYYCYEAACTGSLVASTCGSTFDTKMAIYDECNIPGNVPADDCDDDSCGLQSSITRSVTAGSRYLVRVGGYYEEEGTGQLNLTCTGDPAGACCLASSCFITSGGDCATQGGSFLGAGSDCATDGDGDGVSDACDQCPSDSRKTLPGTCGCGTPDRDLDSDGVPDCNDADDDGDGWLDIQDCESENPDIYPDAPEINDGLDNQCPGEPGAGLVDELSGIILFDNPLDRSDLSWSAQPFAATYEVARSESDQFTTCSLYLTPIPFWSDPTLPAPGGAWYYLVRSYAPYIGSWGEKSNLVERTGVCP